MTVSRSAVLVLVVGLAQGCGDDQSQPQDPPPVPEELDGAIPCPPRLPEFVAGETIGLTADGKEGAATGRILRASSIPPIVDENDWTVAITDTDGNALSDVEILSACVYMPIHGHFLGLTRNHITQAEPGRFELEGVYFNMGGPWQLQLALQSASLPDEPADGTVCAMEKTGNEYIEFEFCVAN